MLMSGNSLRGEGKISCKINPPLQNASLFIFLVQ